MPPLRSATIYTSPGRPTIIAAQHYNTAGIRYEQAKPVVVIHENWSEVASHLCETLKRFSFQDRNLREVQLTD